MMNFPQLVAQAGVDQAEAVARFGGQEALLRRFVLRFPQDPTFPALLEAHAAGDREALVRHVHTLKGVAANLGFGPLSRLAAGYLAGLRAGDPLPALASQHEALCAEYRRVTGLIEQFLAENPA